MADESKSGGTAAPKAEEAKPETSKTETPKSEAAKEQAATPESTKKPAAAKKPAATRKPAAKPAAAKAEPTKAEPTKAEPTKAEPTKAEPAKAEPTKAEPTKAEPVAKPEAPKPAAPTAPAAAKTEPAAKAAPARAVTAPAAPKPAEAVASMGDMFMVVKDGFEMARLSQVAAFDATSKLNDAAAGFVARRLKENAALAEKLQKADDIESMVEAQRAFAEDAMKAYADHFSAMSAECQKLLTRGFEPMTRQLKQVSDHWREAAGL